MIEHTMLSLFLTLLLWLLGASFLKLLPSDISMPLRKRKRYDGSGSDADSEGDTAVTHCSSDRRTLNLGEGQREDSWIWERRRMDGLEDDGDDGKL